VLPDSAEEVFGKQPECRSAPDARVLAHEQGRLELDRQFEAHGRQAAEELGGHERGEEQRPLRHMKARPRASHKFRRVAGRVAGRVGRPRRQAVVRE